MKYCTRSRAVELLRKLVTSGWFEPHALANELAVTPATMNAFLTDTLPMRPEHQRAVASTVIAHVPPLAKQGQRLLTQLTGDSPTRGGARRAA